MCLIFIFLKFIAVTNRWDDGEQGYLFEHLAALVKSGARIVAALGRLIDHERVVLIVHIVDADVTGADSPFFLFVKIHSQIHPVVVVVAVVVSGTDVGFRAPEGVSLICFGDDSTLIGLHAECGCVAGSKHPVARNVNFFGSDERDKGLQATVYSGVCDG